MSGGSAKESPRPGRAVGGAAADWLVAGRGPEWTEPSLYSGRPGILLALHQAHAHFDDSAYGEVVQQGADALSEDLESIPGSSLYFGLTGVAFKPSGWPSSG